MPDLSITFDYGPVPTIREFSRDDSFIRGLMGPFGSGKSSGCVIEIIKRAHAQAPAEDGIRRTRWAIIRNTYQQLRDTSIKTFHDWIPPSVFGQWRVSDHTFMITRFPGVEIEVLFRALDRPDQVDNLLSLELTGAWVNEAREVPWTIIQALQGRVGRYPSKRDGGATWHGIMMDTNPPDEDSWWHRLFEETRPENSRLFRQPSGRSKEAENLENLPAGYYENMAGAMDEDAQRVYIDGEYGYVRDGKPVFPEYNDRIHCRQVKPIPGVPLHRGWDFGLTPACVISQVTPTGQWRIIDEVIATSMGISRFADEVVSHCGVEYPGFEWLDTGDPAGMNRSETDEKTCFQILQGRGLDIVPGEQTLAIRLESVRKPLTTMIDGEPGFIIDPRAKVLRKGLRGRYQYRRMQVSQEKYTDKPDKNDYSHPADALQYTATRLFSGSLKGSKKWEPLHIKTPWVA